MKKNILIVGAGFAGSVIARELAEKGFNVDIIDSRNHIAGNCYDPVDPEHNIRVHKYGPHIFHTNSTRIFHYLSRFTDWLQYQHEVQAYVDGVGYVPFPINRKTINIIYNRELTTKTQMKSFLDSLSVKHSQPSNALEYLENLYGKELTELFFARYTTKMWDLRLHELPLSVVRRLPVRYGAEVYYFDDRYQAMPKEGYLNLFKKMLDHKNIYVYLNSAFDKGMEKAYFHVFNSMAIDDYYDSQFGPLEYRSLKFSKIEKQFHQPVATVNQTDTGCITRITDWGLFPGQNPETSSSRHLMTDECPCSYRENNNERYYPVKTTDNLHQKRYEQYEKLASKNKQCTFIGRCGQYRYLDMHQVVANSLKTAEEFLGNLD